MRRKFQYMNVRYQLLGRGLTGEIATLYVNGQVIDRFQTIDQFYNAMGAEGWELRPLGMEAEGVYTYFVVLQREVS